GCPPLSFKRHKRQGHVAIRTYSSLRKTSGCPRRQGCFKGYKKDRNCFKNRMSFSVNNRRSLIRYLSMAIRSMPIPKANPVYFSESMLQFSSPLGSTIPEPPISTQPLPLQILQPLPPQSWQEISISALGSVKGK